MQNRQNFLPFFLVFFTLSIFIIVIGRIGVLNGVSSIFNKSVTPLRNTSVNILSLKSLQNKKINGLISENQRLNKELEDKKNILLENKALKDQFASSGSNSVTFLPAKVVGAPGFIPGVSLPEYLVIDKGSIDGVKIGSTIIVGNYLVGKVIILANNFSKIELVINNNSSFTAKIVPQDGREISGIIKGKGSDEMILNNVLLSEPLKKDSVVLTKGDRDEKGEGFPPDLIVGKIISIEKKSTDLFQKAEVRSYVNFASLETVFVMR